MKNHQKQTIHPTGGGGGGTHRHMVVHYLAPGRVLGPEACERVWRLQMSCLHLWHQQFFFFKKKKTIVTWYKFAKLPNCACKTVRASSPGCSDAGRSLLAGWYSGYCDTIFPRILAAGADYFFFSIKRGRLFEGGDDFKYCSLWVVL